MGRATKTRAAGLFLPTCEESLEENASITESRDESWRNRWVGSE